MYWHAEDNQVGQDIGYSLANHEFTAVDTRKWNSCIPGGVNGVARENSSKDRSNRPDRDECAHHLEAEMKVRAWKDA